MNAGLRRGRGKEENAQGRGAKVGEWGRGIGCSWGQWVAPRRKGVAARAGAQDRPVREERAGSGCSWGQWVAPRRKGVAARAGAQDRPVREERAGSGCSWGQWVAPRRKGVAARAGVWPSAAQTCGAVTRTGSPVSASAVRTALPVHPPHSALNTSSLYLPSPILTANGVQNSTTRPVSRLEMAAELIFADQRPSAAQALRGAWPVRMHSARWSTAASQPLSTM